jgi:hypothetical protein
MLLMTSPAPRLLLLLAALAVAGAYVPDAAAAPPPRDTGSKARVYRWLDEHGAVHYGDAIPPQYADQDQIVLNGQGVQVGTIPGRRTPEQLQAEASQHAAEEHTRLVATQARQRDQNLLATYLSVEEIEALRDRRSEIVEGQARVTTQYLEQLRARQAQLELQARHFKPYNTAPNASPMSERLAEDLVRTTTDIATQQRNLEAKRQELDRMKTQFASDIARFRELKKIESDYSRGTAAPKN